MKETLRLTGLKTSGRRSILGCDTIVRFGNKQQEIPEGFEESFVEGDLMQ